MSIKVRTYTRMVKGKPVLVREHNRVGTPGHIPKKGEVSQHAILSDGKVHYTGFWGASTNISSDGLTGAESGIISDYTGKEFRSMNKQLLNNEPDDYGGMQGLNTALSNLPDHKGKVYRTLALDDTSKYKELMSIYKGMKGKDIIEKTFLSTSQSKKVGGSNFREYTPKHLIKYELVS